MFWGEMQGKSVGQLAVGQLDRSGSALRFEWQLDKKFNSHEVTKENSPVRQCWVKKGQNPFKVPSAREEMID
jgi:hypothetical protein